MCSSDLQAIERLGKCLEIKVLPAILPYWRADQAQRLGDLVQPSTLHLCWALGWRAWEMAWVLIRPEALGLQRPCMGRPGLVLSVPALLNELERRWPVVRRILRRGLPAVEEDVIQAALHNETAAMLRTPPPSAATPMPINGIRTRQLEAAWQIMPTRTWERTDEDIAAELDAADAEGMANPPKRTRRPKKSESDKRQLVLHALVLHHKWNQDGSIGNDTPATQPELVKLASGKLVKVSKATVSRFFTKKFGEDGHKGYVAACENRTIGLKLSLWQGEAAKLLDDLTPEEYGRRCDRASDF